MDVSPETGNAARRAAATRRVGITRYLPVFVLVTATAFFAYDIAADIRDASESALHVAVESLVFLAVTAMLIAEIAGIRRLNRAIADEQDKTARLSGELLAAMRDRFECWGLSPSESEVALLLIKGLSMKEVSAARRVKEKTIRQQATSVYAKAGCAGRHELVAHFIEDLMNDGVGTRDGRP